MSILDLIILILFVGFILWLVNYAIPMDATVKRIITIFIIVIVFLWILSALFGFGNLGVIRIGR